MFSSFRKFTLSELHRIEVFMVDIDDNDRNEKEDLVEDSWILPILDNFCNEVKQMNLNLNYILTFIWTNMANMWSSKTPPPWTLETSKTILTAGVNILQISPINIEEMLPQNVRDWGRVCQLEGIWFVSRIVLAKSFRISSGKSYWWFRKIFTPVTALSIRLQCSKVK